eukprot:GHRQ01017621.1.p1 GENE.GHRQ01017621.1~~GHRQ01017621.1.p1  ORF type:complete len:170 (-),score=1.94 GHRQ01017621.1:236-745(-)
MMVAEPARHFRYQRYHHFWHNSHVPARCQRKQQARCSLRTHLGMSMPAASQACSTVEPLAMLTGSSFTNTSIVSDWGAACCKALALVERHLTALRQLPSSKGACLTLLSISTVLNVKPGSQKRCSLLKVADIHPQSEAQTLRYAPSSTHATAGHLAIITIAFAHVNTGR